MIEDNSLQVVWFPPPLHPWRWSLCSVCVCFRSRDVCSGPGQRGEHSCDTSTWFLKYVLANQEHRGPSQRLEGRKSPEHFWLCYVCFPCVHLRLLRGCARRAPASSPNQVNSQMRVHAEAPVTCVFSGAEALLLSADPNTAEPSGRFGIHLSSSIWLHLWQEAFISHPPIKLGLVSASCLCWPQQKISTNANLEPSFLRCVFLKIPLYVAAKPDLHVDIF